MLGAWCDHTGRSLKGLRIAIQGFGNVGSWAARTAAERGAVVIAVSDVNGAIVDESGFDVGKLVDAQRRDGTIATCGMGDTLSNEALLTMDCDVLLPAALGEVLTGANAGSVQADVVLEGANYPTTPDADQMLFDAGVTVIPDILANAGGVTGSYFEWTMNIQQFTWKLDHFNSELADRLGRAYRDTQAFADDRRCSLRQAAFAIGVQRVADASRLRGYV